MAARKAPRAVRMAVLSSDAAWRLALVTHLQPVDDLRIVRHGPGDRAEEIEAVLSHDVDVLVWDVSDHPSAPTAFDALWRGMESATRPALVAVADGLSTDLYRTLAALGAREVVLRDAAFPALTEAIYRSAQEGPPTAAIARPGATSRRQGSVTAVFALRGGVGKTSLTIALGAALRQRLLAPVALLDMALSTGNLGVALGLRPSRPLGELLADAAALDGETLRTYLTPHGARDVFVLCAPEVPEVAEYVRQSHVTSIVAASRSAFAATVIDTSATLGEPDFVAAQEADAVLLVMGPDLPSAAAARLALDLFERFDIPRAKVGLVLNRWRGGAPDVKDVERSLGLPVWTVVGEDHAALRAMNQGVPVGEVHGRGPLALAAASLAHRLAGAGPARTAGPGRAGWWRR